MQQTECGKEVIQGLIEILMAGVKNGNLTEAESLLAGLRVLRPAFRELDTFDAWLLIKRKKYIEASHILRNADVLQDAKVMSIRTALLALCLHASNDPAWRISANEVLATSDDAEALAIVNMLFGKPREKQEEGQDGEQAAPAPYPGAAPGDLMLSHYMRA
jgi:type III secretion protein HrpB1